MSDTIRMLKSSPIREGTSRSPSRLAMTAGLWSMSLLHESEGELNHFTRKKFLAIWEGFHLACKSQFRFSISWNFSSSDIFIMLFWRVRMSSSLIGGTIIVASSILFELIYTYNACSRTCHKDEPSGSEQECTSRGVGTALWSGESSSTGWRSFRSRGWLQGDCVLETFVCVGDIRSLRDGPRREWSVRRRLLLSGDRLHILLC